MNSFANLLIFKYGNFGIYILVHEFNIAQNRPISTILAKFGLWRFRRPSSPPGIILLKGGLPSEKISTKELKEKISDGQPDHREPRENYLMFFKKTGRAIGISCVASFSKSEQAVGHEIRV